MLQNSQNDYSKKTHVPPSYKYAKVYQQTGGAGPVLISTSAVETIFEIAPRVINPSMCVLHFTTNMTAGGAANANFLFNDLVAPIRQASLYTRGGQYLMDINNFDRYTQIAMKVERMKEDIPIFDRSASAGNVWSDNRFGEVSGSSAAHENPFYSDATTTPEVNPYEPKYLNQGTYGNIANPVINVSLNFGDIFKNTLLGLDKDLYFNEVLMLRIVWNDRSAWGFRTTGDAAAAGGSTANNYNMATAAAAAMPNLSLANVYLYLAIESNPVIASGLIDKVLTTGMNITVPYVHMFKTTGFGTSTNQTVTIRLGRAQGKMLKKLYHAVYDPTEADKTRYNHDNSATTRVENYYVTVDEMRRSEFNITTANHEDWLVIKDKLKGTCLDRMATYRRNWFILEDFASDIIDSNQDTVDSGLPLDIEHKIDIVMTTYGAAYNHYTYAIVTKDLMISSAGIMLA